MRAYCAALLMASSLARFAAAAESGGFITGVVRDRSLHPIPAAEVQIQSEATGVRQRVTCDIDGVYTSTELLTGRYKVTVRNDGFRSLMKPGMLIGAGRTEHADFVLDVLPLQQEVTVEAGSLNPDPAATGITVGRGSPEGGVPVNGRDVHALFSMLPGAVVTPASVLIGFPP